MSVCVGKVLARANSVEMLSCDCPRAVQKRLAATLAQLQDLRRELGETLQETAAVESVDEDQTTDCPSGDSDGVDGDCLNMELEAEERTLLEALVHAVALVEEVIQALIFECSREANSFTAAEVWRLEDTASAAIAASDIVDGLAAQGTGGLELEAFGRGLAELHRTVEALAASALVSTPAAPVVSHSAPPSALPAPSPAAATGAPPRPSPAPPAAWATAALRLPDAVSRLQRALRAASSEI